MGNTRAAMIAKYGSEEAFKAHMREIAQKGGKNGGVGRGFGAGEPGKQLAHTVGKRGGRISRRKAR